MQTTSGTPVRQRLDARRVALVALLALALSGAVTVSPLASHRAFAVGCNGSSCDGQDPAAMGCDRGTVNILASFTYRSFIYVKLDYAPACQAEWVRWTNLNHNIVMGNRWAELGEWTSQTGGSLIVTLDSLVADSEGNVRGGGWTAMWTYADWGAACISDQPANPTHLGQCTTPRH